MSAQSDIPGIPQRPERITPAVPNSHLPNDFDLLTLLITAWRGKWFILAGIVLSAAVSVAIALSIPNEYKATMVLTPASSSATSSLSRLAGQFGGLASLAGVNLGAAGDRDRTIPAMELIKSWGFQSQFIRDNKLEVAVFAAKGWNRATDQLVIDADIYDVETGKWTRKYNAAAGQTAEPSSWELYRELSGRISISQDKKTSLITLTVEHYSPRLAKEWADKIVVAVNKDLQQRDRLDASKSIKYLEEKMNQTNLAEMKSVFARLIEEQTKNLMLADISDEYVMKTLSPAIIPEQKSGPKRGLICIIGTLAGTFFATLIWFGYSIFKQRRVSGLTG